MAYSRRSRTRSASRYSRRPVRRTRSRRRKSMRGGGSQRIIIQVVGGPGGAVPISATAAKKGVLPLRRRF